MTFSNFTKGFVNGLGWAFGATIGFAILIALIGFLFKQFGHLPVVGNWFNWAGQSIEQTSPAKLRQDIVK